MTSILASSERVLPRKDSNIAEAGHAAVFRNGIVDFEVFIQSSLRFNVTKHTIEPFFQSFSDFFPHYFALFRKCKKMLLVI